MYYFYIWCNHINVDLILFWSTLEIKSRDHGAIWLYVLCRHFTFGQNKSRFLVGVDIINYCWDIAENARLHSHYKILVQIYFWQDKISFTQPWNINLTWFEIEKISIQKSKHGKRFLIDNNILNRFLKYINDKHI